LSLLGIYTEHNFKGIATGDESWFQYSSYSDSMFAGSRESIVPRIRRDITGKKTLLTILFPSRRLLVLTPLPKGTKFNQNYFIEAIFPGCTMKKGEFHAKRASQLFHFTRIIRWVIMVTRSPRNLPREALNELHTHLILQTSVRATFGCLGC
jgi:hypothetical protein